MAWSRRIPGLPEAFVYAAIALASVSTVEWAVAIAPTQAVMPAFHTPDDLHAFDCRDVGGSMGDRAELTYIDANIWNLYAGCRPVFAPARPDAYQRRALKTHGPLLREQAFAEVARLAGNGDMNVVCATPSTDSVCTTLLKKKPPCEPPGSTRCAARSARRNAEGLAEEGGLASRSSPLGCAMLDEPTVRLCNAVGQRDLWSPTEGSRNRVMSSSFRGVPSGLVPSNRILTLPLPTTCRVSSASSRIVRSSPTPMFTGSSALATRCIKKTLASAGIV